MKDIKERKKEIWEEDYKDNYTWEEFDEKYWYYCDRCDYYFEDFCICYAR